MADTISPRAKAILEEVEREAAASDLPSVAPPTASPASPRPGAPAPRTPPVPSEPVSAPRPPIVHSPGSGDELAELVDAVATQSHRARQRLAELSDAIEDIAGRITQPPEAPDEEPVPPPSRRPAPVPPPSTPAHLHEPGDPPAPREIDPRVAITEQASALEALRSARSAASASELPPHPSGVAPQGTAPAEPAPLPATGPPTAPPQGVAPPPPPPRASGSPVPGPPEPVPATPPAHVSAPPPPIAYSTIGAEEGASRPAARPAPPTPTPVPAASQVNEPARLVAVEMAVTGFTRAEVHERLRSRYGIAQPEATLDAVFGVGAPGSSRVPLA